MNISDYKKLLAHCKKLENIIAIIKSADCSVNAPLQERYGAITELSNLYSLNALCEALNVAKGSYYNQILQNKNENSTYAIRRAELTKAIEEIYHESKEIYGSGKVLAVLIERGYQTSQKTVADIMHQNGWFAIRTGAKTIYNQARKRKANLINQQFYVTKPNEVWVSDVTYFKLKSHTYYICVVLDLYARKVIGYKISKHNSTQLVKSAFQKANSARTPKSPLILHSDRGGNYVSGAFISCLQQLGIQQSFSRKGNPYDNSVMESFFKNMKNEELYRTQYRSERELKNRSMTILHFTTSNDRIVLFSTERRHSGKNHNFNVIENNFSLTLQVVRM